MRDLLEALSPLGVAEDDGAEALSIQVAVGLQHVRPELGGDLGERGLAGHHHLAGEQVRVDHASRRGGRTSGSPCSCRWRCRRSGRPEGSASSRARASPRARWYQRTPVPRGGKSALMSRPVGPGLTSTLSGTASSSADSIISTASASSAPSSPSRRPRRAARRAPAAASGSGARARPVAARTRTIAILIDVGGGPLDRRVDRHALGRSRAGCGLPLAQLGEVAAAAEQRRDVAALAALGQRARR